MAFVQIPNVAVKGIAACVPKKSVSNFDCELLDEKERKLFVRNTGIEYRRVAHAGVCASDLCRKAAEVLMQQLQWEKESVNVLIFVTQTPDYITPATAIVLQEQLGLSKNCLAFDINLGCSGYVYGLSVMASLMQNMPGSKGLLLVGDVSTACISSEDKSVAPLFSDAGSATALVFEKDAVPFTFHLQSDGKGFEAIIIPEGGYRHPFNELTLNMKNLEKGITRNAQHLVLNGIDVFNFSVTEVPPNISALMKFLSLNNEDIDFLVMHQANKIINESIADALEFSEEKVPLSLKNFGNTSSASIPLTMVTELNDALRTKSLNFLLSGFGVGLSWGSVHLKTEKIVCPEIIEY